MCVCVATKFGTAHGELLRTHDGPSRTTADKEIDVTGEDGESINWL